MLNLTEKIKIKLYLISDASGETVTTIAKAIAAQFEEQIEMTEYLWPLVRSKNTVNDILSEIEPNSNSIVLYTMLDVELRLYLEKKCESIGILAIFALENVINELANFANVEIRHGGIPGKYKKLDANYYKRIDILNFTLQHDDGHDFKDVNEADILILGVSRTSKSPTSLYLAQRGYKVANLPIINGVEANLSDIKKPILIGLTISAEILSQIRSNRLNSYNLNVNKEVDNYTEIDNIKAELSYALEIFRKNKIPIIDVSRKAIEEVAAEIINIYAAKKGEYKILL
ncbi:MAG: pyruvate, water dikinase regulatory protein [Candidatus Midichloria sp.]|uniref:Kinase/pyrophosphorylase n=1 Tax=Hyalomma marginatum TaxID=34627 RepID=A0A8S4C3J5_9ACAR|nr:kinase/pyrophosphorylase [Hyalomma marginatum]CAG7600402.1 kinase/pyrophosphorylase [Hyalomma marginatum]